MSKSSGKDDINTIFMDKIIEASMNLGIKLDDMSETMAKNTAIQEKIARETDKFKNSKRSEKDAEAMVKGMLKGVVDVMRVDYGVEPTKKLLASIDILAAKFAPLIAALKDFEKYEKRIATTGVNYLASGAFESMRGAERGVKSSQLYFKNTLDNEKMKSIYNDFAKRIGVQFDSAQYKIISFFQGAGQNLKKTIVGLGKDLLEGLEKSKWVGGALRDTFRLVGLLGANWLSQFGKLGKIMGGAFYVAMELAGPTLVKLLLQGVGKILLGLPKLFGAMGWGNVAGAAIGTAGAMWAFNEAGDSWKKGRKGNAITFGAGGAAMGAGAVAAGVAGIASLGATAAGALGATGLAGTLGGIAAALGPIGWTLIAIGAAVAGIAVLWKHHSETIKKWAGKFGSFVNKVIDFMALWNPVFKAIQWIRDFLSGNLGKGGSGNGGFLGLGSIGGNNANKGTGIADSIIDNKKGNYVTYGKMKVSKRDGSILNLNELSQNEASEALQMYEKADPTSFHRVYEWLSGDKASLASHSTDAVKKVNGKTVAALSAKGTSQEIDELRSLLVGMSPEKAAEFVQTSGKLTGSNTQHGVGGWHSHNNAYGLGRDLAGGSSWTARDYLDNYEVVKKYYNARGFEVNLERPGQGKSTGWHYDIKPMKNIRPEGAQENFENYDRARATETTTKMMGISEVVKSLDTEDKRRFAEELKKVKAGSSEELAKKEEAILNKMGIYSDVSTHSWMRNTANGTESLWYDAAGNARWREVMTTLQGAEVGSTGR